MSIKLNGVEIIINRLNFSNVSVEKLNGTVVYSDESVVTAQWQFVGSYSSEPDNYDFFTSQYINGDYQQGLNWLHLNFQEDLIEGFIAVIADMSTLDFFEFVVVLV